MSENGPPGEDEDLGPDLNQGQRSVGAAVPTPAPMTAVATSLRLAGGKDGMMRFEAPPGLPAHAGEAAAFSKQVDDDIPTAIDGRIIVRTVDTALVVDDVSAALDTAAALARELGGWVVQSNHSEKHRGYVSFRVPADRADEAIDRLRHLAVEVKSEISTSRDVTDEYVDNQARLKNLEATEKQLLKLMERTGKVSDLLQVQRELTQVQGEMERLKGRIKLLEQTSAFSLINVSLELAPATIEVDAGLDQTVSEMESGRFRASLTAPEGITEFRYEWDFGDGSEPVVGTRTAPGVDGTSRTTATVTHTYRDKADSPFIVTLDITGTGEAGVAEGEDTLIVTVTRIPVIEVFAGQSQELEAGDTGRFTGSFTRPEGVDDLTFRWDFGDGSEPISGDLSGRRTTASAGHAYPNHRPQPFTATLTISGTTEGGMVTGTDSLQVSVLEASAWSAADASGGAVGGPGVGGPGDRTGRYLAGHLQPLLDSGDCGGVRTVEARQEDRRLSEIEEERPPCCRHRAKSSRTTPRSMLRGIWPSAGATPWSWPPGSALPCTSSTRVR